MYCGVEITEIDAFRNVIKTHCSNSVHIVLSEIHRKEYT